MSINFDANTVPLLLTIYKQVNALEHEIDQMVYRLYGLTEKEIKIVENFRKG